MTRSAAGRRRICGHTEKDPTTALYAVSACEPADPYSRLKCDLEPPRESVQQSPLLVCCTQTTSVTYRPYPACPPAPSAVSPVSCISPGEPYYYCTAPFADAPAVTLDLVSSRIPTLLPCASERGAHVSVIGECVRGRVSSSVRIHCSSVIHSSSHALGESDYECKGGDWLENKKKALLPTLDYRNRLYPHTFASPQGHSRAQFTVSTPRWCNSQQVDLLRRHRIRRCCPFSFTRPLYQLSAPPVARTTPARERCKARQESR